MIYFENNFLDNIYEFFVNIALNLSDYVVKLLWILLICTILRIFWFFLSRLRITIKYQKKTPFFS
ncbi:hypothetical protein ES708_16021 [subsurface metagenome]